jgi:rare lipoprotein A
MSLLSKIILCSVIFLTTNANAFECTASYYTRQSCLKESGQCVMANGKELNDERLCAASWDYSFGTQLRLTNKRNGRKVVVSVTDRGPAKRLYKVGRRIDLSLRAFSLLTGGRLDRGVITIEVERIGD